MAWTYDPSMLGDPINQVRLKIGDTNSNDPQLQDEEIELFLDEAGSVEGAVRRAALALAAFYSRQVDKWVGDLKILASQRARAYREMVESLTGTASTYRIPSAGGIYVADKEATEADDSLVVPSFRRNQFDNVGE